MLKTLSEGRDYTYSRGWTWALTIGSAFFFLLGPACFLGIVVGGETPTTLTRVLLAGSLALAMSGLGVVGVVGLRKYRITLFAESLEYHSGMSLSAIRKEEIAAMRTLIVQGIVVLRLFDEKGRKLASVSVCFEPDQVFRDWFSGITDLDEQDVLEDEMRIANDTSLGLTPATRRAAAERGRNLARWVDLVSFPLCLLTMFYPRPYAVVVGLTSALPIIAIVLLHRFGSFIELDSRKGSARRGLDTTLVVPGCALGLRALFDANLVEPSSVMIPTAVITIALLVGLRLGQRNVSIWKFVLLGTIFWSYPASVLALGNRILDTGAATEFSVGVLGKREVAGKPTTRYVTLGPAGPWDSEHELKVSKSVYDNVFPGEQKCLLISPGAFQMSWWTLRPSCQATE